MLRNGVIKQAASEARTLKKQWSTVTVTAFFDFKGVGKIGAAYAILAVESSLRYKNAASSNRVSVTVSHTRIARSTTERKRFRWNKLNAQLNLQNEARAE